MIELFILWLVIELMYLLLGVLVILTVIWIINKFKEKKDKWQSPTPTDAPNAEKKKNTNRE